MIRPLRSARCRTVTFLVIAIFTVIGSGLAADSPEARPEFVAAPVPRNGDFSRYQSHGRPAEWNPAVESGKHDFRLDPAATGREFMTKPLIFKGRELTMNFWTSAVGSVRMEFQDEAGTAIPGFALADCPVIYGYAIEEVVKWNAGSDVSALAGKPVRLRFVMTDADVFSIRFRE